GDQYSLSQQSGGGAPTGLKRWSHIDGTPSSNPIQAAGLDQTIAHPQLASKKMFVHPKSGRLYVGYEDLYFSDSWRTTTMDASIREFIPTAISGLEANKIIAFDVNFKDETRKYVAYDRMDGTKSLIAFKSNSWVDITQGSNLILPVSNYPITDVTTDPLNADHVWVSFSGFNIDWSTGEPVVLAESNRVFYSADAGNNWEDVSRGLPGFPVNSIIYQQGSDDILYVGTDVGVYVWNKEIYENGKWGKWECFSTALPICIISELDINYCAGKLRAATFGRGMWESDLRCNASKTSETLTTNNETWSYSKRVTNSITIESGKTLTISGTSTIISMAKNTFIKVMPKGKLIIDGATLTNSCDQLWAGIIVVGDPNHNQYLDNAGMPEYQGMLVMKNGAKIENAYVAVTADDVYFSAPDYAFPNGAGNKGGGIIEIDNSTFTRNRKGIGFAPYHAPLLLGNEQANKSYIYNSTFTCPSF
ncbi:MAG: hypothetical protein LH473_10205, partial [Chitinophagales bacterium]|nr:hypothetical protein [Chitinophagales bacterium]